MIMDCPSKAFETGVRKAAQRAGFGLQRENHAPSRMGRHLGKGYGGWMLITRRGLLSGRIYPTLEDVAARLGYVYKERNPTARGGAEVEVEVSTPGTKTNQALNEEAPGA
jgi:hypothetical protein